MTTIETVLTRMMSDADFAETVFADPEKALAGYDYDLTVDDVAKFKSLTRTQFDALVANPEERISFGIIIDERRPGGSSNHNETIL